MITILVLLALLFAILALCNAPGINWCALGVLCLAIAGLAGSGLLR